MSFQWIFDNASQITVNRKKVVSTTTSRDGTTRAVSRGGQAWRFEVAMPAGVRWTDARPYISTAEALDRVTAASVQINNPGLNWFIRYQGNSANSTGFVATINQGSTGITLTTSPTTSSGYRFRAGDFIQLGSSGKVYTVAADVAFNSSSVTLHRPVIEASAAGVALNVGANCVFSLLCTQFPEWTLLDRDIVGFTGPFVFVENLV
jgi:hypothetical protein